MRLIHLIGSRITLSPHVARRTYVGGFIILGAASLAGCAGAPSPDAALLQARADYAAAANDPGVVSTASDQLRQSQTALQQSEQALQNGDKPADIDHYALLASRYAAIAQQTGKLKAAQQVVANAPMARSQALLDAQATRTQQAEQQAQMAQQQAMAEHDRAQQAESDQERLQREIAALQARQTPQGLVLSPREILFNPGSAVLQPGAEPAIQRIASFLKDNSDRNVLIEGFTDSTGSAAANQRLSEQRADAVRLALMNDGVPSSRVQIRGMSDAQPIAGNDSSAGRLVNRRVEILISNANGTFQQGSAGSTQPR